LGVLIEEMLDLSQQGALIPQKANSILGYIKSGVANRGLSLCTLHL